MLLEKKARDKKRGYSISRIAHVKHPKAINEGSILSPMKKRAYEKDMLLLRWLI